MAAMRDLIRAVAPSSRRDTVDLKVVNGKVWVGGRCYCAGDTIRGVDTETAARLLDGPCVVQVGP
jgi:hypothetical protein